MSLLKIKNSFLLYLSNNDKIYNNDPESFFPYLVVCEQLNICMIREEVLHTILEISHNFLKNNNFLLESNVIKELKEYIKIGINIIFKEKVIKIYESLNLAYFFTKKI